MCDLDSNRGSNLLITQLNLIKTVLCSYTLPLHIVTSQKLKGQAKRKKNYEIFWESKNTLKT